MLDRLTGETRSDGPGGLVGAVARLIFGVAFLVTGLAVLGFEMRIAFGRRESLHWFHLAAAVLLLLAAWATVFTALAGRFFGWLGALARSVRSGKA